MGTSITSCRARREQSAAIVLALQHLDENIRSARLHNALALVKEGVRFQPRGFLVARDAAGLRGVQICSSFAGSQRVVLVAQDGRRRMPPLKNNSSRPP